MKLAQDFGLSIQRAAHLAQLARSSFYYQPQPRRDEAPIIARMQALIDAQRSIGLPMLHDILRREGLVRNHKRTARIYRAQGLTLQLRRRRKRAALTRRMLPAATRPNERWSMDFMQETLWQGRRFRLLTIVDQFTKECPVIAVDTSLNGGRVARVLDELALTRGLPTAITVDNGPEFAGRMLDRWAYTHGVRLDFIRPGKPVENAFIESFNGRLRQECLNQHYFLDLAEARRMIEAWRLRYNDVRPHRTLAGLTPEAFARQWQEANSNPTTPELSQQPVQCTG